MKKQANLAIIVIIKIRQVDEKMKGKNSLIDSLFIIGRVGEYVKSDERKYEER